MNKAHTIPELLQVLDAVDVHTGRVKLKGGGFLRAELHVEDADREEVAALSDLPAAHCYTVITDETSVDAVELRMDHVIVLACAPERTRTDTEALLFAGSSDNVVINTVKGGE